MFPESRLAHWKFCQQIFARMLWHVIILSFVPIFLSITVWIIVYTNTRYTSLQSWSDPLLVEFRPSFSLSAQDVLETAFNTCGPLRDNLRVGPRWTDFKPFLIWTMYANCLASALFCVSMHIMDVPNNDSLRSRLGISLIAFAQKASPGRPIRRILVVITFAFAIIMWSLSFADTYYLYDLFIKNNAISKDWYFGQIIAINAWTPFLVELIYLELGEFFPRNQLLMLANRILTLHFTISGSRGRIEIQISTRRAGCCLRFICVSDVRDREL